MNKHYQVKPRILIIEDEICCVMSLQLMFHSFGCEVLVTNSSEEALELLAHDHKSIDLILLDIMLPGMTGLDFLDEAKKEEALTGIPVVIQSAEGEETIKKALEKGACGYIHKPHVRAEVLNLVTTLMTNKDLSPLREERICA